MTPEARARARANRRPPLRSLTEAVPAPLPRLLWTIDEVAAMFGKAPRTIKDLCWAGLIPYRKETHYFGRHRRTHRMVMSMREIQAALDYFAPPVEVILDQTRAAGPGIANSRSPSTRGT